MVNLDGGCLCGVIRYRIESIFDVVYCHCTKCGRRNGGPVSPVGRSSKGSVQGCSRPPYAVPFH